MSATRDAIHLIGTKENGYGDDVILCAVRWYRYAPHMTEDPRRVTCLRCAKKMQEFALATPRPPQGEP